MNDCKAFAKFLVEHGFKAGFYKLEGFGNSYFLIAPDGDSIVPVGDGIVKKHPADVNHWKEGWIIRFDPEDEQVIYEIAEQVLQRFSPAQLMTGLKLNE